jgi:hypothetical protein
MLMVWAEFASRIFDNRAAKAYALGCPISHSMALVSGKELAGLCS